MVNPSSLIFVLFAISLQISKSYGGKYHSGQPTEKPRENLADMIKTGQQLSVGDILNAPDVKKAMEEWSKHDHSQDLRREQEEQDETLRSIEEKEKSNEERSFLILGAFGIFSLVLIAITIGCWIGSRGRREYSTGVPIIYERPGQTYTNTQEQSGFINPQTLNQHVANVAPTPTPRFNPNPPSPRIYLHSASTPGTAESDSDEESDGKLYKKRIPGPC